MRSSRMRGSQRATKKLHETRGDSLVEALAALLITVFGATLLATMVTTSVSIISNNRSAMEDAYAAQSTLATSGGGASITSGTVGITGGGAGFPNSAVTVEVYEEGGFTRYEAVVGP